MVCVYALTGRAATVRATGLRGERLYGVTIGAVTAIAGNVRAAPAPAPAALRRYDAVIRELASRHAALLPVRFGTCFADPYEISYILRARQPALRAALASVRGRVQMNVRVVIGPAPAEAGDYVRRGAERADAVSGSSPTAGSHPGTAYLQARAEAAARARHVPRFDPVRIAVRRWVRDERVEKRAGVASVYHLVPRASAAAYAAAARRALIDADLKAVVTGPWAPYAFADAALFES
jgi:hypothetical protein